MVLVEIVSAGIPDVECNIDYPAGIVTFGLLLLSIISMPNVFHALVVAELPTLAFGGPYLPDNARIFS